MGECEDHVKRGIAKTTLDAGQVAAAHPNSTREFLLLDTRSLAQLPHATAEPRVRRLAGMGDLATHLPTLWRQRRPTTSRRLHA